MSINSRPTKLIPSRAPLCDSASTFLPMPRVYSLRSLGVALAGLLAATALTAGPIEFTFTAPPAPEIKNPFARELWAEVTTPSARTLLLPAFYAGDQVYAVRARPDELGAFTLGRILESSRGQPPAPVAATPRSPISVENKTRSRLPAIAVDATSAFGFRRADGRAFFPLGTNLAWARGDVVPYYRSAFTAFAAQNLNWMRVWMAHWGQLNLDWPASPPAGSAAPAAPRPPPGYLDAATAARWDELLAAAEEKGVYIQLVLQHHGQFSTTVNPNWADHPWNAANPGGFLKSPSDFFTDPNARLFTALKYRYIVARYGWSTALFAWELFNEVHWVDALKLDHNEAAVARWHDDMAKLIRAVDAYAHPVTTSTEDLRSPIYASMDFLQPHLYAANLIAGARTFAPTRPDEKRPIFYGEFGDDHLPVSADVKKSGLTEAPPVWASLMGPGPLAAQPWEGWKLLETGRLAEIGAVYRFVALSGWTRHRDLQPFATAVESTARRPRTLPAGQYWQRRPGPDLVQPADGREPLALADWPASLIAASTASESGEARGFPARASVRTTFAQPTTVRVRVAEVAAKGGSLRVSLNDTVAAENSWPASTAFPTELTFAVPAGEHTLTFENVAGPDWVRVSEIDFGDDTSALAAIGKRNDRFLALWVRHVTNLFSLTPAPAASGTLVLDDVPAGSWKITWWDTTTGQPAATPAPTTLEHAGGPLRIETPAIERHAAVVLVRAP